jgi:Domain of unknown function (DUF4384)
MSHEQGAGAHPTGFELDAFAISEAADAHGRVRLHVDACSACRERVDQFRRDQAQFSSDVFPRTLPRVTARAARSPRWTRALWVAMPAAASVALASTWALHRTPVVAESPAIAVKGGPAFEVVARRSGQVFNVRSGATLARGDDVRFVARPGGLPYLLVLSIDSSGRADVYFPYHAAESGLLPPDRGEVALPGSITLDATAGPERLFAIFSKAPVNAGSLLEQLRTIGSRGPDEIRRHDRLDTADAQLSVVIEKAPQADP